jgi:hypothetical protein
MRLRGNRGRGALVVVAAIVFAACGRLDRDAVQTDVGTVQSAGAEGMLVADQAAQGRAPADFIEIRTAELSKQAEDASTSLAGTPAENGLEQEAVAGAHLGARIADHLDALHRDPGNRALAARTRDLLRALSRRAGRIEDSL